MPETNMNVFDSESFKCDDYVKNLVQECVGGSELQQQKVKIQNYSDQTSSSLKKHVYANYMQFIETAKEISHLESEMYQLSHLLIEQHNILSMFEESNLSSAKDPKRTVGEEDDQQQQQQPSYTIAENKKLIAAIKEALPSYTDSLNDQTYIYEGGLIELDSDTHRPICRVHLFLLNNLLIIAKIKHDKKLEFLAQYNAGKIAVINIRDLDGVTNSIKVITPDGPRILQCVSQTEKKEWIKKFEVALKFNQTNRGTKKPQAPKPPPPAPVKLQPQQSTIDTKSITSGCSSDISPDSVSTYINWGPDWLQTAPEEIQAMIAQRHFEETLVLITKCEEFLAKDQTVYGATDFNDKIKHLKTNLCTVLLLELSNCQSRSLHAALRSSRRPLKLLSEMGKAREACGTLLKVCSTAIRTSQRQARRNNLEISELFFCDLAQVASEFLKAFSSQAACISTLVVWCNCELQYFATQLCKHYLSKGAQLQDVAKCVEGVRKPCAQLTEIGLDLSYHMEGLLRQNLEQIIDESRLRLVETIGRTEESWQPYNLQTKSNLRATLRELDGLGIDMKPQVTGDTWINLTQTTVSFCRHFLIVTESCGYLAKNDVLKQKCEIVLKDLFLAQHCIKPNPTITVDLNFVARNKSYLCDVLLLIAIKKFETNCNGKSEVLAELLQQMRGPPKPKPRSIYKTDVL